MVQTGRSPSVPTRRTKSYSNTCFCQSLGRCLCGSAPEPFKFALNAVHDTLPHNANVHLWKKKTTDLCPLCGEHQMLIHLLNVCNNALHLGGIMSGTIDFLLSYTIPSSNISHPRCLILMSIIFLITLWPLTVAYPRGGLHGLGCSNTPLRVQLINYSLLNSTYSQLAQARHEHWVHCASAEAKNVVAMWVRTG